jgi:hypothetical protein
MLDLSKEKLNLSYVIMENSVIKYRTLIERIILFCYLLIFSLDILHFHNYDFNRISAFDIANKLNLRTQVSRSDFECIIHQNLLSLQTAITNVSNEASLLKPKLIFCPVSESKNKLSSIHLSDNFLRGPPILSYFV